MIEPYTPKKKKKKKEKKKKKKKVETMMLKHFSPTNSFQIMLKLSASAGWSNWLISRKHLLGLALLSLHVLIGQQILVPIFNNNK